MDESWIEKIEQYLDGAMNDEERLRFESEMRNNADLSDAFKIFKSIEKEMRHKEQYSEQETALKDSLANLNASYFSTTTAGTPIALNRNIHQLPRKKRSLFNLRSFTIAAVTIGIVATIVFLINKKNNDERDILSQSKTDSGVTTAKNDSANAQKTNPPALTAGEKDSNVVTDTHQKIMDSEQQDLLFASNFKADDLPENTDGPLADAFALYSDKRYTEAAEEFTTADLNKITRGVEADPKLNAFYIDYYGGISYLADNKTNKAISALKDALAKSSDSLVRLKTEWYLALAYLKTGDVNKAAELLTKISRNRIEKGYKEKSEALLKQLK